jgi:hypothetical protein
MQYKIVIKYARTWNYDNEGDNLCNKSSQQTMSNATSPENEFKISDTWSETEHWRLKPIETCEEWPLWIGNFVADEGFPDGRSFQTGLVDEND